VGGVIWDVLILECNLDKDWPVKGILSESLHVHWLAADFLPVVFYACILQIRAVSTTEEALNQR
jgi:hypothetical protein